MPRRRSRLTRLSTAELAVAPAATAQNSQPSDPAPAKRVSASGDNKATVTPPRNVANVLTLGYAAQAAGLVYILATARRSASRYRLSSAFSAVVMASAMLELYVLVQNWTNSFVWNGWAYVLGAEGTFANGYRYMNWSVDVPVLLKQLLIVLGFSGWRFWSLWTQFVICGLLIICTGYTGQFYEATNTSLYI